MSEKPIVRHRLKKRIFVSAALILLIIPAVLILCSRLMRTMKWSLSLFGHPVVIRLHYAVSLLIIICTMIPFFMIFEKRKPQARELVTIATLSAIAVISRAAFFMLPQFKPMSAVIIIAGVCFGPESGFLVGAVSCFVSNMFFGQGSHTPWQMFCFGIIGFIAGLLFHKGLIKRNTITLCIYGGLSVFFIYGGIVNFGSLLNMGVKLNWKTIVAYYASGFLFDLIHAGATVVFLFLFSRPMIEILERIRKKYGLIET